MSFTIDEFFRNGAVLPHSRPLNIYGEGEGEISVTLNGETVTATAENGKWRGVLPPMECGGPYTLKATCGVETLTAEDIYIGEVILLLGQSNLQFKIHESTEANDIYEDNGLLRLYTIDRPEEGEYFKAADGWVKATAQGIQNWSAIGYHLANELNRQKEIAVGLIACYQGASKIQSWLPKEIAASDVFCLCDNLKHPDHKEYYMWNYDGFLYDFSLSKLFPYSLSHVVYYQGESNTAMAEAERFDKMLCALIEHIREKTYDADLPVTVVQIADFLTRNDEAWRAVQQAQLNVQSLTHNVKTVICADVCENDNIHPPTKRPLAIRIAKSFDN